MKSALALLQAMRPKHYIKNILLFVPLFFSGNFFDVPLLVSAGLAFVLFSLICSSIYLINDLVDYPYDVNHPVKKDRPIASGRLGRVPATVVAVILFILPILGLFYISLECGLLSLGYYVLNIGYTFWLKKIPLLDAFCVAIGFTLRIFIGAAAVGVIVSYWLFLTVLCLSLFLAFGKRRNEMLFTETTGQTRRVLASYDSRFLEKAMFSMMTLTIAFYSLWIMGGIDVSMGGGYLFMISVPVVILALLRYLSIVESSTTGDPTTVILKDPFILILALVLVIILGLHIYFGS